MTFASPLNEKCKYHFEVVTIQDCSLKIELPLKEAWVKMIFSKLKNKVSKDDVVKLEKITIEKDYLKYISTVLYGAVKNISKEIKADKIEVLNLTLDRAEFIINGKVWVLNAYYNGLYVDKRK